MKVTFHTPAMSTQGNPITWTGEGSVEITQEGITFQAFKKRGGNMGCLIALGAVGVILLGAVLGGQLKARFGLGEGSVEWIGSFLAFIVLGGVFALMRRGNKSKQKQGEAITHAIAWSEIKKVYWDEMTRCLVLKIKSKKVKGVLHIVEPNGSELQQTLQKCLVAAQQK